MDWTTLLVTAIVAGLGAFSGACLKTIGADLAKMIAIKNLTDKVESVKNEYAKGLESIKSELAAKHHFLTARYEKEFRCYEEVWPLLIRLRDATTKLSPLIHTDGTKQQAQNLLEKCTEALRDFYTKSQFIMPFVEEGIFENLNKLYNKADDVAHDFANPPPADSAYREDTKSYWMQRKRDLADIGVLEDSIRNLIRKRIKDFDPPLEQ